MSATDYLLGRQGFLACSGGPPTLGPAGMQQIAGSMLPVALQSQPARGIVMDLSALGFVQCPVQEPLQPQVLPTLGMPQSSALLRLGGDGVGFGTVFHNGMAIGAGGRQTCTAQQSLPAAGSCRCLRRSRVRCHRSTR